MHKTYYHKFINSLTIIFLLSSLTFSQIKIHKKLTVEDGLVQSQVTSIFKDSKGYLWFGTLGGVSRWDGINFKNIQIQDGLTSPLISAISEGPNGEMIFCTNGGGITIIDGTNIDTLDISDGLADNHVYAVFQDESGKIYFGTAAGISIYQNGNFTTFDETDGLAGNRVTSIYKNENDEIFFCTASGVTVMSGDSLYNINTVSGLTSDKVTSVIKANDGSYYFGTWGGGITIKDGNNYRALTTNEGLSNDVVFTLVKGNNNIFAGTWGGGINIINKDGIEIITESEGLGNNVVMSVYESDEGTVYIGTDGGGISIYGKGKFITYDETTGLAEKSVRAIFKSKNNALYFGTDGSGITILSDKNSITINETTGLPDNRVRDFLELNDGTIIIATFGGGLAFYKNGVLTLPSNRRLLNIRAKVLCEDKNSNLLIGTYNNGVLFYNRGKIIEELNEENGLSSNFVNDILETKDGKLFIATWGGVTIKDDDKIEIINTANGLINNYTNALHQDRTGKIYIGTDGGLNLFQNDKLDLVNTEDGLTDNTILGILEDNEESIYLSTNRGVNILDNSSASFSIRTLRYSDGLASDECNQNAVYKDNNGFLWFGTSKGVTRYDPSQDKPDITPPIVHLTRIRIFEDDILPEELINAELEYNQNYIKLDYIGIDLPTTEKVIYRYKLTNVDENWVETDQRFVQYTNLDNNDYEFIIQAKNQWGYWSNQEKFSFAIMPPFWETWWFRFIIVVLVLFALWYIFKLRIQKLLAVEKMRVRIASDLHDDIGAALTHISVNSEMIKRESDMDKIKSKANKIGSQSREVIQSLGDIVWSIDSRNDSAEDLLLRMKDLAHQILIPKEIKYKFTDHGVSPSKKLNIDIRENIYLIYKEAINNIAKHSNADKVEISLINNSKFIMRIKDNGTIAIKEKHTGHGLRNMKMRAEKIKGDLSINFTNGFEITLETKTL